MAHAPFDTKYIFEIATISSGTTPYRGSYTRYFYKGTNHWVKTLDLNNNWICETDENVTDIALKETSLRIYPEKTVLVAMYGGFNQIGRTGILKIKAAVNQALSAVQVHSKVLPEYLILFLNYRVSYWEQVASSSRKDPNINSNDIKNFKVSFPPIDEQNKIVDTIASIDNLIFELEKLISKKLALKKAATQELLGIKNSSNRITKKLGEIASIKTGSRNNQDKVAAGNYPFFVRSASIERINSYSYDCEAILVPGEGGIGSIFHYVNGRFDVHQRVYAITNFSADVSAKYIYYYMKEKFGPYAMENSVKATVDSLRLPTFLKFDVLFPKSKEEQLNVVKILTEMEHEIELLEKKLQKIKFLKHGTMQELLTGRIRLT